jgi:hypothetical protein
LLALEIGLGLVAMSNFIAGCVAWAEFLTFTGFGAYALGPIIWEVMQW